MQPAAETERKRRVLRQPYRVPTCDQVLLDRCAARRLSEIRSVQSGAMQRVCYRDSALEQKLDERGDFVRRIEVFAGRRHPIRHRAAASQDMMVRREA